MQISAKRRPASKPPAACAPQSMTRVPLDSVATATPQRLGIVGQPVGERQRRGR